MKFVDESHHCFSSMNLGRGLNHFESENKENKTGSNGFNISKPGPRLSKMSTITKKRFAKGIPYFSHLAETLFSPTLQIGYFCCSWTPWYQFDH